MIKLNSAPKKDVQAQPKINLGLGTGTQKMQKISEEDSEKSLELMCSEDTGPTLDKTSKKTGLVHGEISKGQGFDDNDKGFFGDMMSSVNQHGRERFFTHAVSMKYKPADDGSKFDKNHYNLEQLQLQNPVALMENFDEIAQIQFSKEKSDLKRGLTDLLSKSKKKSAENLKSDEVIKPKQTVKIAENLKAGKLVSEASEPKVKKGIQFEEDGVEAIDSDEMDSA